MEYSNEFREYVTNGIGNYFIGIGNPNANILFIGKELAISPNDAEGKQGYDNNALDWKNHIDNGRVVEYLEYPVDDNNHLRKTWGKNTWSKYQRLSDHIWDKQPKPYYVDFLKTVFTTEINDSPGENTAAADKSGLKERKTLFKNSGFIQSFPVVVLACSGYIKNNDERREIDEIFGVTYDGDSNGKYEFNKGNWFFVHHNHDASKIVVHTRQLSADVKNDLLEKMGEVIRRHLKAINLLD